MEDYQRMKETLESSIGLATLAIADSARYQYFGFDGTILGWDCANLLYRYRYGGRDGTIFE